MWKGLLDKGKCLLGFHEGTWSYRRAGDCSEVMTCKRCGIESQRIEHCWDEWAYKADGSCDLLRTCSRCRQTEQRLQHAWSAPQYRQPDNCEQIAICTRCDQRESRGTKHVFDRWFYQNQDDCTQMQSCSRCHEAATATRLQHDWSGWTSSDYYESRVQVCRHCGEMTVDAGGGTGAPSMQVIEAAVDRLMAAGSWEQIRAQMNSDRSTLLSPAADKYFKFAFDEYPLDEPARAALLGARRLLTHSRSVGIDQALQELGGVPPAAPVQAPSAVTQAASASPAPHGQATDRRLIGHWRSTESMGGGGGFSMVTDTHCELDGAGNMAFWSRTVSGLGESISDPEYGRWEARDQEVVLTFNSGDALTRDYVIEGDSMVWPGDTRYRLWTRIG